MSPGAGLRIAYVISFFPSVVETFVLNEILELRKHGLEVEIFSLRAPLREPLQDGARDLLRTTHYSPYLLSWALLRDNLVYLASDPAAYLGTLLWLALGMLKSPTFLIKTLALFPKSVAFAGVMRRLGVRHIHAHWATHPTTAAVVASRLNRVPFSFTAHAHDIYVDTTMLPQKMRAARFISVISELNRRLLLSLDPGCDAGKIHVIRTGADVSRFRPAARNRLSSAGSDPITILSVGRLTAMKGFPYLLEACGILRRRGLDLRCWIVGDGEERGDLGIRIRRLGLEGTVELKGWLSHEQLVRLYEETDIFVLPSVVLPSGSKEGIPVALMEAMAAGLPVVATALSGIPELVTDGESGVLVPERDSRALAEAVHSLATNPERAHRFGRAGRERVLAEFTMQANAARLAQILKESITAGVGSAAISAARSS